jgi:hypothetical protein
MPLICTVNQMSASSSTTHLMVVEPTSKPTFKVTASLQVNGYAGNFTA